MSKEIKKKILKTLKDFGELPTARVASIVGLFYPKALRLLQEMWEEGSIVGNITSGATYWNLKGVPNDSPK